MSLFSFRPRKRASVEALVLCFAATISQSAHAQQPASVQSTTAAPAPAENTSAEAQPSGGITEDSLKQQLAGKTLYIRSGYLDSSLSFNEHGQLLGHSPQGSYTLSLVQIDKVHLTKRRVELEGVRYGLHFLGALPNEDPSKAVDKVRITPKKKVLKITIDRELVVIPKKKKEKGKDHLPDPGVANEASATPAPAPETQRSSDPGAVTTTTSPAHSAQVLRSALDQVFASGLDDQLIAAMPDYWKLYYQAAAAHTDYRPTDPAVYRQTAVDQKARLLSTFEPPSNEYAQTNGVAGMALYHAVIGADGKPQEIVVGRPIGFGLDENAVDAIRKASFEPAVKEGKPVPVLLDMVVQFRIYSKRTEEASAPETAIKPAAVRPGPYSLTHE